MDFSESTKVVFDRIQKVEPENVSQIIGYLLFQNHGEHEMIRLAFCPDALIHSLINRAKSELGLSNHAISLPASTSQVTIVPNIEVPLGQSPNSPLLFTSLSSRPVANAYWDSEVPANPQQVANVDFASQNPPDSVNPYRSNFSNDCFYSEPVRGVGTSRRSQSLDEFPVKVCQYFLRGNCKHGNNCRYFHAHPMPRRIPQVISRSPKNVVSEDNFYSPRSLEKLEMDLTELLVSRKGVPISIASLPELYHEKFGRTLQAEGYLTESQRHGRAGYNLTKLLARMKNNIRLTERPHGQHSLILAKDLPECQEPAVEKSDVGEIVPGSRQIYLTFFGGGFTEQDVANYFNKFGPVQDVRIPCQQINMFGFVTFFYAETAQQVLEIGNPHFVRGARILAKPYREKLKSFDRRFAEKISHQLSYSNHHSNGDPNFHPTASCYDDSRSPRKQPMNGDRQAVKVERIHFSDSQLAHRAVGNQPNCAYSTDELKVSEGAEGQVNSPSAERFTHVLDIWNNGSTSENNLRPNTNTTYNDHASSHGSNLPDSPFASPVGNRISTAT